jgi:hypothetical protein
MHSIVEKSGVRKAFARPEKFDLCPFSNALLHRSRMTFARFQGMLPTSGEDSNGAAQNRETTGREPFISLPNTCDLGLLCCGRLWLVLNHAAAHEVNI